MKTNNIEQQLHDYYRDQKTNPPQSKTPDDIDYNLIARYVEGSATPEEIEKIETQAETNDELRMLSQTLTSTDKEVKFQTSNIFSFSHPMPLTLLCCAAAIIIFAGSFFIVKKIHSSLEADGQKIVLRGATSSTTVSQQPTTNKEEKVNSEKQ